MYLSHWTGTRRLLKKIRSVLKKEGGLRTRELGRGNREAFNMKIMVEETTKEEVETALVNAVEGKDVTKVGDLRQNGDNTRAPAVVVSFGA